MIELNSLNEDAWHKKGLILSDFGRHEEAIECYNKVMELNPSFADAWFFKGMSLFELRRYEEALKCYEKAIELDPSNMLYKLQKETCILKIIK